MNMIKNKNWYFISKFFVRLFVFFIASLICSRLVAADTNLPFKGNIDLINNDFSLTFNSENKSPVSLDIVRVSESMFKIAVKLDHYKILLFDISTLLESIVELGEKENTSIKGRVWSKYTLINYKPVDDLLGRFELEGQELSLNATVADNISCKGIVNIIPPYSVNLSFQLSDVALKDFILFFTGKEKKTAVGKVNGNIDVTGNLDQIILKGKLVSYEGIVDSLKYNDIILNAQGEYPDIYIEDSVVTKSDGMIFNISGKLDLLDRNNFEKQIKSLAKKPVVTNDGSNIEWTLKRFKSQDSSSVTELKYLKRKDNNLKHVESDSTDMLGVEQKVEF